MKRIRHLYLSGTAIWTLILIFTQTLDAQIWHADIAGSTVNLSSSSLADDMNSLNGGPVSASNSSSAFVPNLMTPSGDVDWGVELNVVSTDGGITSSAGSNYVTIDGDGSDKLTIRWQVAANLSAADGSSSFNGHVASTAKATIKAVFDMAPGTRYRLYLHQKRDAIADSIHESVLEDPVSATDSFVYMFTYPPGNPFPSVSVGSSIGADADPRLAPPFFPPIAGIFGDGSSLITSAGGEAFQISLNINDRAIGDLRSPGAPLSNADFASAFAKGEIILRMELVPEPATGPLVLLTLLFAMFVQHRAISRALKGERKALGTLRQTW